MTLFEWEPPKEPDEKHKKLKKAMDELNARFGDGAVMKASLMKKPEKVSQRKPGSTSSMQHLEKEDGQ